MTNYLKQELYQKISQSPELFDFIQDAALDGLWYWDLEQPEQEWMNPRFWTLLGFDPAAKQHLVSEWQHLIDPNDLKQVEQNFKRHLADPSHPFDQIVRYRHRLGHTVWVRCRGLAVRNEEGVPVRLLGAHTDITDLMLKKEELTKTYKILKNSEAKFRGLFESSPVGIAMNDYETGEFLDFNAAINEPAGYTRDEFLRLTYWEVTPKEYESQEALQLQSMQATGHYGPYQKEYIRKDGSRYPVLLHGFKTTTPEGREVIWSIIQNISELEEARRHLEDARHQLNSLVDNIPGLTFRCLYDAHWTMVFMTRAADPLTGYSARELINNASVSYAQLIHPEDVPQVDQLVSQAVAKRESWEVQYRVRHKDGSVRWAHERGRALYDQQGKVEYLDGFIQDVTEQVQAEKELRRHQKLLDNFFSQSVSGFFFMMLDEPIDWQGADADQQEPLLDYALQHLRVTKVNQAMLDQYGALEEDFLGLSYQHFFPVSEIEKARHVLKKILDHGRTHAETNELRLDGKQIIVKGDYTALYDEQGLFTGYFGIQQDVTEQKRQEKMLQQAKAEAEAASRAKSEFLANMSHEIRTPMNGILGMSELGLQETDLEKMRHQLVRVNQSGRLLLGIINDILDFSKIEAGKLELDPHPFQLDQLREELTSLLKDLAENKNLAFNVHCQYLSMCQSVSQCQTAAQCQKSCTAFLYGDLQRLRQVLTNLISNAIKFTESGEVCLMLTLDKTGLECAVKDTGIGMTLEQQARLFHAFTQADTSITRKHGGTGLGLVISERLVRLMGGGDIQIHSQFGVGSTFSFRVPLRFCTPEEQTQLLMQQQKNTSEYQALSGRVLLVEDNEINQEVTGAMLTQLGVTYAIAANGQVAVEKAQQEAFDLILMDIQMPVMDGYQATQKMRELDQTAPIIALTAAAMIEDKNKALEAGMNDHLPKPIDPHQLYLALAQYLPVKAAPPSNTLPYLLLVCADKEHLKSLVHQVQDEYRIKVALDLQQAEALIGRTSVDLVWLVVDGFDVQEIDQLEVKLQQQGVSFQRLGEDSPKAP
ncbi:PAS domain S-box protein [Marinospirillum sp.]|uniref:PAS domain-containing hybrid sensor histidine kinase/response regulator n=1 Tax=Marinospirillum sp. TaxID=2183934 RepID=UPI003A83B3C2